MTVCDIVNQFTHTNFTLIVIDVGTDDVWYEGPASDVCDDAVAAQRVVAMEPPVKAGEVILYIDIDAFMDIDYSEYYEED